jgi:hypothetical protein
MSEIRRSAEQCAQRAHFRTLTNNPLAHLPACAYIPARITDTDIHAAAYYHYSGGN